MTQIFLSALPNQSGQLLCDMLSSGYVYVTCFPQVTCTLHAFHRLHVLKQGSSGN